MPRSTIGQFARVVLVSAGLLGSSYSEAQPPPPPPAPAPLSACAAAVDCGLSPQAIVVADASGSAASILSRLESAIDLRTLLAQHLGQLRDARAALAIASRQAASVPMGNAVQTAQAEVDTAKSTLEATRLEILEYATDGLSAAALQRLSSWRDSVSVDVPPEFRARARTAAEWSTIEGALRAEKRAQRRNESLGSEFSMLLSGIRADLEVIAAAARLSQQLAEVEEHFEDCTGSSTP